VEKLVTLEADHVERASKMLSLAGEPAVPCASIRAIDLANTGPSLVDMLTLQVGTTRAHTEGELACLGKTRTSGQGHTAGTGNGCNPARELLQCSTCDGYGCLICDHLGYVINDPVSDYVPPVRELNYIIGFLDGSEHIVPAGAGHTVGDILSDLYRRLGRANLMIRLVHDDTVLRPTDTPPLETRLTAIIMRPADEVSVGANVCVMDTEYTRQHCPQMIGNVDNVLMVDAGGSYCLRLAMLVGVWLALGDVAVLEIGDGSMPERFLTVSGLAYPMQE
jgi:hypothetical protein